MSYSALSEGTSEGMSAFELASAGQRFGAWLLDWVIAVVISIAAGLVGLAIGLIFLDYQFDQGAAFALIFIPIYIAAIAYLIYWTVVWFMVAKRRQSPGKIILGIRIENIDGSEFGFRGMLIREILGKFLAVIVFPAILGGVLTQVNEIISSLVAPIFYLGLFGWILVDEKNQTLHDKIASTIVVKV